MIILEKGFHHDSPGWQKGAALLDAHGLPMGLPLGLLLGFALFPYGSRGIVAIGAMYRIRKDNYDNYTS
jgi:hypothetical protein